MGIERLLSESRITLQEVANIHTRGVDVSTVRRWCTRGVRGVTLESFVEGGERFTTSEAYERFIRRQNGEDV